MRERVLKGLLRLVAVGLALALAFAPFAYAFTLHYSSGAGISATEANTNTAFTDNHSGGSGAAFNATEVLIRNTGADTVFYDMDGVATTSDTAILKDQSIRVPWKGAQGGGYVRIGLICAAGKTATVYVDAWR